MNKPSANIYVELWNYSNSIVLGFIKYQEDMVWMEMKELGWTSEKFVQESVFPGSW